MAGNFHVVLIFVIFMVDLAVTKITTHKINDTYWAHAQAPAVGMVDAMTNQPSKIHDRTVTVSVELSAS